MGLGVRITKRLPDFDLEVSFSLGPEQILAIVGPSGAGKTTILRAVAGLERPDAGRIVFNETIWFDRRQKLHAAPQKRRVGYVSQGYGLFPHLTVEKNVAFAASKPQKVGQLLDLFGIAHLAQVRPARISGGERQRVALAQALAAEPGLLLLDEPFSALDFRTKELLRDKLVEMKQLLALPMLVVTHDLEEAALLADRILPVVAGAVDAHWLPAGLRYVPAALYPASGPDSQTLPSRWPWPARCAP